MYGEKRNTPDHLIKFLVHDESLGLRHRESSANPPPPNTVLLLEHRPVFTVGRRDKGYPLAEEQRLQELGADFVRTDGGGLITFHGPGQLVAYPMLDLASLPSGRPGAIRWYVEKLETSLATLCRRHYGIRAGPVVGRTGVWVEDRKIAAIGISVKQRRFTSHGIALNVCTDMTWFSHIIPCGIEGAGVTSLSLEYGFSLDTGVVAPLFAAVFADVLGCEAELEGMPERMPIV